MMDKRIENLLSINSVSPKAFEDELYTALLNGVFETICKEIKKENTKVAELSRFRKSKDHILVTKGIVKRYAKCTLSEAEYEYIYHLLRAFFAKKSVRVEIPEQTKLELLKNQKHICPYCKTPITIGSSHLDHIVPWDFVGDELDNNYQMLCSRCNERKGTSSLYGLSMILYNPSVS